MLVCLAVSVFTVETQSTVYAPRAAMILNASLERLYLLRYVTLLYRYDLAGNVKTPTQQQRNSYYQH